MKKKKIITICLGSSCYRRGNQNVLEVIKNFLSENDLLDEVEFKGQLCEGKCTEGPVLIIDETEYCGLDENTVIKVLHKHFPV